MATYNLAGKLKLSLENSQIHKYMNENKYGEQQKMNDKTNSGIIYILTNPVMPGLIKIGITGDDIERRVRKLSSQSGIPVPFEVYYACEVERYQELEKVLHEAFGDRRVNPKREFFRIDPERVLPICKHYHIKDVTPGRDYVEDNTEQQVLDKARKRRSHFRFSYVQIEAGSTLNFVRDENIEAIVVDDRNVKFEGEEMSLTASAKNILLGSGWNISAISGPNYWTYEGETLSERRFRMEEEDARDDD
jgi:hypothetical protein